MPKRRFLTSRVSTASSIVQAAKRPPPIFDGYLAADMDHPERGLAEGTFVSIDPGLQGTGFALWTNGLLTAAKVLTLPSAMRELDWPMRADQMVKLIFSAMDLERTLPPMVCEMMEYQGGGMRGLGWRSGDMQRTTYFIGLLAGTMGASGCPAFGLVPVHRWKGQLPKKVVEDRLKDRLGAHVCAALGIKDHAWDAVGIGMWAMGKF